MSANPERSIPAKQGAGNFFAIDKEAWPRVCALGLNPAVAYLVLARFSQKDNRKTAASVQAIENYTGISRRRAKNAIQRLISEGFIVQTQFGWKPRYEFVFSKESLSSVSPQKFVKFTDLQQKVFQMVNDGISLSSHAEFVVAKTLVKKGNLANSSRPSDGIYGRGFEIAGQSGNHAGMSHHNKWIWLPNEIVSGAANETPPVELLRQIDDVMSLRLFVELYYAQNLAEDGGVSRQHLFVEYKRRNIGQRGPYTIWGFREEDIHMKGTDLTQPHYGSKLSIQDGKDAATVGADFFCRLEQLYDLGLFEWVPHLIESSSEDAEIIHPYEGEFADAAQRAAEFMMHDLEARTVEATDNDFQLAPIPNHIKNVQMVGIARLRYRPKTRLTLAWYAERESMGRRYAQRYAMLCDGEMAGSVNF